MPKIIANLENRLMQEAQRQIRESGYNSMTIRSVANGCGVGVGTVYNYFTSKEDLLARSMLTDWNACLEVIGTASSEADRPTPVLQCIHDQLIRFSQLHQPVFRDAAALTAFLGTASRYHSLLRSQLSVPLKKFCRDAFTADFIAEALLTWTMAGTSFEVLLPILEKLL